MKYDVEYTQEFPSDAEAKKRIKDSATQNFVIFLFLHALCLIINTAPKMQTQ